MRRMIFAVVMIAVVGVGLSAGAYALRTTGQEEPPGLAKATPTPDTSSAKDEAGARDELAKASPELGKMLDAIAAGDVGGLLALIDWEKQTCGVRRDVDCGKSAAGETIDVVNAGWPVDFFVPADVLRPSLEQVLSGKPLQLRFASQSKEAPAIYYLGFDGQEVKGKGLAPLADSGGNITGLFITVDVSRTAPIVLVEAGITDQYSATKRGSEIGFDSQRLIRFDDQK